MGRNRALTLVLAAAWLSGAAALADWEVNIDAGERAYHKGDRVEAEKYLQAALKEAEVFGDRDERLAATLNDMGVIYDETKRFAEGEAVYKRALAIRENLRGPDHVDVATSCNNLANLYKDTGKYDQAESLYKRAIAIYTRPGKASDLTAMGYSNLAHLYEKQGREKQALAMYEKALADADKVLGPSNPHTVDLVSSVALGYEKEGRNAEALPLFRRYLTSVATLFKLSMDDPRTMPRLKEIAGKMRKDGLAANADLVEKAIAIVGAPAE